MVEHFLPGGVKLAAVLLQQPLLSQGDGLLRCPQNLHRPLKLLSGLLGFNLRLKFKRKEVIVSYQRGENHQLKNAILHELSGDKYAAELMNESQQNILLVSL